MCKCSEAQNTLRLEVQSLLVGWSIEWMPWMGEGRGGGIEGKQAGKVLIWSLNPTWPDLLADLSSSVFWDRLIGITDGPAGWWALYLMTTCRVLMPRSLVWCFPPRPTPRKRVCGLWWCLFLARGLLSGTYLPLRSWEGLWVRQTQAGVLSVPLTVWLWTLC